MLTALEIENNIKTVLIELNGLGRNVWEYKVTCSDRNTLAFWSKNARVCVNYHPETKEIMDVRFYCPSLDIGPVVSHSLVWGYSQLISIIKERIKRHEEILKDL